MKIIKVIAQKGTQCPKENKPRQYITDRVAIDVKKSLYYRRLISDGSLIHCVEVPVAAISKKIKQANKTNKKIESDKNISKPTKTNGGNS